MSNKSEQNNYKPWFVTWWGILLVIVFFPILIPYLVWTKTKWNKLIKVGITGVCVIIIISTFTNPEDDSELKRQEALNLVSQAETFINENKPGEASTALDRSKELYSTRAENPAFELKDKINKLKSRAFMKTTLVDMSDEDFELLKKGELKKSYIDHGKLNELFIIELQENADQRTEYIAITEEAKRKKEEEIAKKKQEEEATARKKMIEEQFSAWDGSHVKLTRLIKDAMNDPDSYEHDKTVYQDMGDHLIVTTTFRGKNAFGGIIKNIVKAKISLDGEDIEVLEQY